MSNKIIVKLQVERWGTVTYVDKSTISISIECSRLCPIKIVPIQKDMRMKRKENIEDTIEVLTQLFFQTK